jgi:hypothetical protein
MIDDPNDYCDPSDETEDCWNCGGEGFMDGDCICMEDTCACREPEPPTCTVCGGSGCL